MTPLTIPAAAQLLGISRASMYRLVRRGLIQHLEFPVGGVRIEQTAIEAFKARCRREPLAYIPTARRPTRAEVREATDAFAAKTKREAVLEIRRAR
ncbi:MAG: helix-turn-helix domain-containing protein [Methanomicrobiales archaeon]|nr:helix-turn-helix domain-containing protein [Methanomicrobiales archaeon]